MGQSAIVIPVNVCSAAFLEGEAATGEGAHSLAACHMEPESRRGKNTP